MEATRAGERPPEHLASGGLQPLTNVAAECLGGKGDVLAHFLSREGHDVLIIMRQAVRRAAFCPQAPPAPSRSVLFLL